MVGQRQSVGGRANPNTQGSVARGEVRAWQAESPRDAGVQWLHAEPVYVGRLPVLAISDPAAFGDAAVRVVVVGDATAGGAEFALPLGTAGGGGPST